MPSHTHTQHTCTHTPYVYLCPRCTGTPRHTQFKAHTQVPRALTHVYLKAAEHWAGGGGGGEVAWSLTSQRLPPQYVPDTPTPAPSSTQVHGAQYCLGVRCVTAEAGTPPPQAEKRGDPGPYPWRSQGQARGPAGGKASWKEALGRKPGKARGWGAGRLGPKCSSCLIHRVRRAAWGMGQGEAAPIPWAPPGSPQSNWASVT